MTSRPMDSTLGGPVGEERGGKISPYPLCGYGGATPILLWELDGSVVVDMRAVETLPVVVDVID